MGRMYPEVYEALRCVMPEERATQGDVRITEAVLALNAGRTADVARSEVPQARATASSFDTFRAHSAAIRRDMRIITWMLALTVLLTFICCLKVYSN